MNPFDHLTLDEQRALIARSSSGEHPIFSGEEASGPIIDPKRYTIHSGQFFEVEPEQLIDVAKHMAQDGDSIQKTIEKAYTLICEAHLVSRNICHWNEKTRRGHVSERLHSIVTELEIKKGKDKGKVARAAVLKAFIESRGMKSNETNDGKLFNKWMKESLRMKDYCNALPWNPSREDFDDGLYKTLIEKGWIRWMNIGSSGYLILPERTQKPRTKSRKKAREGDHITRPWWETKTVWWPDPTKDEVKELRAEYLVDNAKHFRSSYSAKQALEKFERWLDITDAWTQESAKKKRNRKQQRSDDDGKFS